MKQAITPKGVKLILAILIVGLIAVILINTFGPAARQIDNMRIAGVYAEAKTEEIKGKTEFERVSISAGTASNGCVLVHGMILEENEDALKAIVYTEDLPTAVAWKVRVIDQESWDYFRSLGEKEVDPVR